MSLTPEVTVIDGFIAGQEYHDRFLPQAVSIRGL
jgi:hypothetical protein